MTTKDFEGLNATDFIAKVADVTSLQFLSQIFTLESNQEKPRKTVLAAIETKRLELIEVQNNEAGSTTEDKGTTPVDNNTQTPPAPRDLPTPTDTNETPAVPIESKNNLEDIQDEYLPEFADEVAKIDSRDALEELRKIEFRDDHRKGAFAIIDARLEELNTEQGNGESSEEGKSNDDMILEIKDYRKKLDKLSKMAKKHFRVSDDVTEKTFYAKAWLGKLLAEFGAANPYKKATNLREIPKTADVYEERENYAELNQFGLLDVLVAVNQLRDDYEEVAEWLKGIETFDVSREASIARTNAYNYTCEAKFELGRVLSEIRKD